MIIRYGKKQEVQKVGLIMLSSITYAYKAKNYLEEKLIKCHIMRTPSEYTNRGCGYSLKLSGNLEELADELSSKFIKVLGYVYI